MITCYLDSQDYSVPTDPKQDSFDRRKIKEALLHLAHSKQVHFEFSAAAVCESVAITDLILPPQPKSFNYKKIKDIRIDQ